VCGRYLSFAEREEMGLLRAQHVGVREIARRREGLYSSHLTAWRAADRQGVALTSRRGPAPTAPNPLAPRVAELERALAQATRRADRAELIIDAQKKFSQLIGLTLPPLDASREPR